MPKKKKKVLRKVKKATKKPAKKKLIGKIDHYFDNIGVAAMTLGGVLEIGDIIQIEGGTLIHEQEIISLQIDHTPVKKSKERRRDWV